MNSDTQSTGSASPTGLALHHSGEERTMRNRKPGHCCWCGMAISPGEGNLQRVDEEDENLGFGPMGMTGWLVSCLERNACQARRKEEREKVHAERASARLADERERALFPREAAEYDSAKRAMPAGTVYEREGRGHDIYGYGTCYVDDGRATIWEIMNNGSDGADWSKNNISTGGAGAIGRRYSRTEERLAWLAEQVNVSARKETERQTREAEREAERQGLRAMLIRVGGWETLETKLKTGARGKAYDSFCPEELKHTGKKYTIASAKNLLSEEKK